MTKFERKIDRLARKLLERLEAAKVEAVRAKIAARLDGRRK
jgi:hypothetical protein